MAGEAKIYALSILPNCRNVPNSQKVLEIRPISLFRSLSAVALAKAGAFCAFLRLKNPFNLRNPRLKKYSSYLSVFVAKTPRNLRNPWLINDLCAYKALYTCRDTSTNVMSALQIKLFMQNEPKFQKVKLNVNKVITTDYDKMDTWSRGKKQSQTNPNKAKFKKTKMNVTSIITKGYENKPPIWAQKKQSQTSKRQKPMQTYLPKGIMKNIAFSAFEKANPNKANFKGALTC